MRVIKFRAWDGVKMLTNAELTFVHCGSYDSILCDILDGDDNEHSLMQFTGLTDKNGVDIYEGDIVDDYGQSSYIIWRDDMALFGMRLSKLHSSTSIPADVVIIGNIYQNPELLK